MEVGVSLGQTVPDVVYLARFQKNGAHPSHRVTHQKQCARPVQIPFSSNRFGLRALFRYAVAFFITMVSGGGCIRAGPGGCYADGPVRHHRELSKSNFPPGLVWQWRNRWNPAVAQLDSQKNVQNPWLRDIQRGSERKGHSDEEICEPRERVGFAIATRAHSFRLGLTASPTQSGGEIDVNMVVDKVPAKAAMKAAAPGKRKAPEESTVWDPSSKSPKPDSNGGSADHQQISGANALAVVDPSAIGGAMVPDGKLKGKVARGGSKYKGVYRDKNVSGKYKCSIRRKEREVHLGYYGSEEEAARAYDKAHWCCKSSTKNFDISTYDAEEMAKIKEMPSNDLTELRKHLGVGLSKEGKEGSSKYRGVCKEKKTQKFRAEIQIAGKKESLGYHANEMDAVRAYDRALIVMKGDKAKTNLPIEQYDAERAKLAAYDFNEFQAKEIETKSHRNANWTSNFRGVRRYTHKQKNDQLNVKWRAEITVNGKKKSLGYHDTQEEAARAYDKAVVSQPGFKRHWLNFPEGALPAPAPAAALPAPGDAPGGAGGGARGAAGGAGGVKARGGLKAKKAAAAAAAGVKEEAGRPEGGFLASLAE